ncbi:serine/threonine protein kinase, partial [Candidatus Magnetomorum sp. HK-1]
TPGWSLKRFLSQSIKLLCVSITLMSMIYWGPLLIDNLAKSFFKKPELQTPVQNEPENDLQKPVQDQLPEVTDLTAAQDQLPKITDLDLTADKFTNNLGMTFVRIPKGKFMMGSPETEKGRDSDESPQHKVILTNDYFMQTTEVTQGQWKAIMGENPSYFENCGDNCPVERVSWNDIQEFINRLNQKSKQKYRLPTEAEWEYAARAGSTSAFANGDIKETGCGIDPNLNKMGWYCGNSDSKTHPVAQKQANQWQLFDMHGNVYEWCSDWFADYQATHTENPVGPNKGSYRVIRGGGWNDYARDCRSANRLGSGPTGRDWYIGFRLVVSQASGSQAR